MSDQFDAYTDVFHITVSPWGANLVFGLRPSSPESTEEPNDTLGVIRMGHEHLKVMCFMIHRQMVNYERELDAECVVPERLLAALNIPSAEWAAFWKDSGG